MTPKQFANLLSLARHEMLYPIDKASRESYRALLETGLVLQSGVDSLGFPGYTLSASGASTIEWGVRSVRKVMWTAITEIGDSAKPPS